jgi:hypothetical protein
VIRPEGIQDDTLVRSNDIQDRLDVKIQAGLEPTRSEILRQNLNLFLLALSFGLTFAAQSGHYTCSALVAHQNMGQTKFATLPLAVTDCTSFIFSLPMARVMQNKGRGVGFAIGGGAGIVGACVCALGIHQGSFAVLCIGSSFFGVWQVCSQYIRFAAVEAVVSADERVKSRAVSLMFVGRCARPPRPP